MINAYRNTFFYRGSSTVGLEGIELEEQFEYTPGRIRTRGVV